MPCTVLSLRPSFLKLSAVFLTGASSANFGILSSDFDGSTYFHRSFLEALSLRRKIHLIQSDGCDRITVAFVIRWSLVVVILTAVRVRCREGCVGIEREKL